MKNIKNLVVLLIAGMTILSCSTDEKAVDFIFDNTERGAILRTLNSATTYNFFDPSDTFFKFEVGVEAQGDNIEVAEIRLFQSFKDNTEDGTDNSKAEVLVSTAGASSLVTSDNGFPSYSTSMLLSEALTLSGLSDGQFFGGDQFVYRFELELTDGRVFSDAVGGTVSGGSFFTSPFSYTVGIKCVPVIPFTGDYTLNLADTYGDGWDGAIMLVTIDGTTLPEFTAEGFGTIHNVNVPEGTASLEFVFDDNGSCCAGEHSYKISYNGLVAAEGGPSPTPGTIFLNICPD